MTVLAKLLWRNPIHQKLTELRLSKDQSITIGRAEDCDIRLYAPYVSRQHALITYEYGTFIIKDLESKNGVYVNNRKITETFPLVTGDEIRISAFVMYFQPEGISELPDYAQFSDLIPATYNQRPSQIIIESGTQRGMTFPLLSHEIQIGRATPEANWDILIEDKTVSAPHIRLSRKESAWVMQATKEQQVLVNNKSIQRSGYILQDKDRIQVGNTILRFRSSSALDDEPNLR